MTAEDLDAHLRALSDWVENQELEHPMLCIDIFGAALVSICMASTDPVTLSELAIKHIRDAIRRAVDDDDSLRPVGTA